MNAYQQALLNLIAEDQLTRVFDQLKTHCLDKGDHDTFQQVTIQAGRYQSLSKQYNQNIISQADYQLELSRIRKALIDIIQGLSVAKTFSAPPLPTKQQGTPWKKWGGILVVAIAVLAGLAQITGVSLKDFGQASSPSTNAGIAEQELPSDTEPLAIDSVLASSTKKEANIPLVSENKNDTPPTTSPAATASTQQQPKPRQSAAEETQISKVAPSPPADELPTANDAPLSIQVRTNKGSSNLRFQEGEKMRLYFKVNRPCYVRIFYNLAGDSGTVLFDDDRQIVRSQTGQFMEIGDGFICAPPLGQELLYVMARSEPFPPLNTYKESGYEFIIGGVPEAVERSKPKGFVKDRQTAETKLSITTYQ